MLELLIGVVIFSFAMLPLLVFGTSSTRGAYSVGKHMMAGQIAASLMDQLLAMPYDECYTRVKLLKTSGKIPLMDEQMLKEVLQKLAAADSEKHKAIEDDLKRSFKFFRYAVNVDEASGDEKDQMIKISIQVFWRVQEGVAQEQSLILSAIKFLDDL